MPATLVGDMRETATARSLLLDAPDLGPAAAGQHIDVRLTAEDGYTAQRSYSLSSAAGAHPIAITVERFDDGEVSPYLVDDLAVGEAVEVRGPVGGWLVWRPGGSRPVQLIAGGSGIAPLMSMIRTREASGSSEPFRLLAAVTAPDRLYYRAELDALTDVTVDVLYSRRAPTGTTRPPHRVDAADLAALVVPAADGPDVFVCGPTGFVEAVAGVLVAQGHEERRIRTERFGPTG